MAGISKKTIRTKKGTVIKYTISYYDIFGIQHTSGIYDTKKEAKKDMNKYNNKEKTSDNITFGQIIECFMEKVNKKYSKSTKEEYQRFIDNHLYKFYDIKYKNLNAIIFQKVFDDIEKETPFTAYNMLKFCKAAVNYCMSPKINLIGYNIFKDIEPIILPESKKQNLTLQDALKLMKTCTVYDNLFFPILFSFILNGMREGELFALTLNDINFSNGTIRINKQFTGNEYKEKTKTDKSNRYIFMFPIYILFLDIYLPTLDKKSNLVFPNSQGGYLHASNLRQRHWQKLLLKCGYDKDYTSLHKLRAFFIDLMFYLGVPGKFTQGQVGHAKYETTYNTYASNNASIIDASIAQVSKGMGLDFADKRFNESDLKKSFINILESYIINNPKILNKTKELKKVKTFFGKKCEQNVSKNEIKQKDKIIKFPKRCQEL